MKTIPDQDREFEPGWRKEFLHSRWIEWVGEFFEDVEQSEWSDSSMVAYLDMRYENMIEAMGNDDPAEAEDARAIHARVRRSQGLPRRPFRVQSRDARGYGVRFGV